MILFSSKTSPFARKILLSLHSLDLVNKVEIKLTDPRDPKSENLDFNPLAKIPTLLIDNVVIHDSNIIMDYLNENNDEKSLFPFSGIKRMKFLTSCSLINSTIEAAVLISNCNRFGHKGSSDSNLVVQQKNRIRRVLLDLEKQQIKYKNFNKPNCFDINLVCLLDYLDFRKPLEWQEIAPSLINWITDFSKNATGYHETLPPEVSKASWRTLR